MLAAGACLTSYWLDCRELRQLAVRATQSAASDSEKVISLARWVQSIEGTRENDGFFLIRKWRATPMQVVQKGGDCADKSRLLWAMLREIGIRSTMVMCFHRETRQPTGLSFPGARASTMT
jgi:transglutaminase-like putative cysteine protease